MGYLWWVLNISSDMRTDKWRLRLAELDSLTMKERWRGYDWIMLLLTWMVFVHDGSDNGLCDPVCTKERRL